MAVAVFTANSVMINLVNRPFITSSKPVASSQESVACGFLTDYCLLTSDYCISNHRHRKRFRQPLQIQCQCQSIFMPQHAAAMRHIARRLVNQQRLGSAERPNHFIGRNSQPYDLLVVALVERGHHHLLRREVAATRLAERNIHHRNDRTPQVENPHQKTRRQRHLRDLRPLHHFLYVEHRQAKPLPPSAKNAVLPLRRPLFGGKLRLFAVRSCFGCSINKRFLPADPGYQVQGSLDLFLVLHCCCSSLRLSLIAYCLPRLTHYIAFPTEYRALGTEHCSKQTSAPPPTTALP